MRITHFYNFKSHVLQAIYNYYYIFVLLIRCNHFMQRTNALNTKKSVFFFKCFTYGKRTVTTENVENYFAFKYLALSGPDEGYSRNASCALNLISTFLFTSIFYYYVTPSMELRITGTL